MSNKLLNSAWAAQGLEPSEKLILVNLADRANAQNECFPGHRLIASDTGLSERTVRDGLRKIEVKGHLTVKSEGHRAGKDQSRFTYIVHPKVPETASRVTPERISAVTPENGAVDTGKQPLPHRKNSVPTPENGAHHITSINQINPKGNQTGPPEATQRGKREREPWQLQKDRKSYAASLREERQKQNPDRAMILFYLNALKEVKAEMKALGMPTEQQQPKQPIQQEPETERIPMLPKEMQQNWNKVRGELEKSIAVRIHQQEP